MKVLNNAGIKEIVFYEKYERIKTGGEGKEEESEATDLAKMRKIKIRQFKPDMKKLFTNH
jgi:deoxycytidylate deaminase